MHYYQPRKIPYLQKLQTLNLRNPVLVGFGIRDRESFQAAGHFANGAIIGTAFIKALEGTTDLHRSVKSFMSQFAD